MLGGLSIQGLTIAYCFWLSMSYLDLIPEWGVCKGFLANICGVLSLSLCLLEINPFEMVFLASIRVFKLLSCGFLRFSYLCCLCIEVRFSCKLRRLIISSGSLLHPFSLLMSLSAQTASRSYIPQDRAHTNNRLCLSKTTNN